VDLRAVLHFVYEWKRNTPRYSLPYFLRGKPNALIGEPFLTDIKDFQQETIKEYMEYSLMTTARPWSINPGMIGDY